MVWVAPPGWGLAFGWAPSFYVRGIDAATAGVYGRGMKRSH